MRDVVDMKVKELSYTEIFPDESELTEQPEDSFQKIKRILHRIVKARFFFPIVMYMSASALFFTSIRYFGLRKALWGVREVHDKIEPLKIQKRRFKARLHRHNRRILLMNILASRKTKKSSGYQKLIKVMKLYKPVSQENIKQ